MEIKLIGLEGIPLVKSGDDISKIIKEAILNSDYDLCDGDIILIAETLISKAEGNIIKLDDIVPSDKAVEIAEICKKDRKLVELILQNSTEIVEVGPNFIVTETKQGFVCANAAIDGALAEKNKSIDEIFEDLEPKIEPIVPEIEMPRPIVKEENVEKKFTGTNTSYNVSFSKENKNQICEQHSCLWQ